jgi:hypothetical protein
MSIMQFLNHPVFDIEIIRAMDEAFESARRVLRASDHKASDQAIAEKIIVAAANGERDSAHLRDIALRGYGIHR